MRITFVMDGGDNLSGGHRTIAVYAHGLAQLGHQVKLVARPQRPPTLRDRIRSLVKGSGKTRQPGHQQSNFTSLGLTLEILPSWRPVEDRDLPEADVVVATWWETVEWVAGLAPSKGVKTQFFQDYEIWAGRVAEVDRSCRMPLPKIVTSEYLKDLLETNFQQTPIAIVPSGVDRHWFGSPERSKQSVPTVGLTYYSSPYKGCDISLEAYRRARRVIPELRLIAGGTSRVSENLPLPEDAIRRFWLDDEGLRGLYSQCDAWLFGSRREGFGLPMLEAMSCRTPVIGTPAGVAPQLLQDDAGILVKAEDPEDMAQAILRVARLSDAEWRALSARAHDRAALYTWDKAIQGFERALEKAVEHAGAHPCR